MLSLMSRRHFVFVACALLFCQLTLRASLADRPDQDGKPALVAPRDDEWLRPEFWQALGSKPVEKSWRFGDGTIRLAEPRSGSGNLLSRPLPPNFELSWKYKITEGTNSGVKYRVRQYGNRWLGVEYQIIDEPLSRQAHPTEGSTASMYDIITPSANRPIKPAGQWNSARIVADRNRLEHYLNGELVAETPLHGPQWQYQLATSKFGGLEDFGQPTGENRVILTDHGGEVTYKDFRFTTLDSKTSLPDRSTFMAPQLGNGMRNGWADQSSIVLWTRTTARPEMVTKGPKFMEPDAKLTKLLDASDDSSRHLQSQLPDGHTLNEMFGSCAGAAGEVRLTYFPAKQRHALRVTQWQQTRAEHDFTRQWKLENLKPGTAYVAVIQARPVGADQTTAVLRGEFRTAPATDETGELRFCMTTCHDFLRRDDGLRGHKIYPAMTGLEPDFVIHAGDVEYYDKPKPYAWTKELMRFKWARIFSLPNYRDFYSHHTSYFLKDDHDTLKNDCWAGQTYGSVTFEEGMKLFNEEQFPSHQPRYKTVRWGKDLQIWILEGRDYRSPNTMPDGPEKTILGQKQKQWLFETLAESAATFKLVISPTPIVGPDRKHKRDNHANDTFAYEGAQIRDEFAKHRGLIVLCGDRHWQYASKDAETGLWEFGCGPGSAEHQLGWQEGDRRPEHEFLRVAGGFLSGDLQYAKPEGQDTEGSRKPILVLRHRDVDGKEVSRFEFPRPEQR